MPRKFCGGGPGGYARLGVLAGGVDLDMDIQRRGDGGVGFEEDSATSIELGGFLDSIHRRNTKEVRYLGGEWFAFVWEIC